jgi:hypothetical protein
MTYACPTWEFAADTQLLNLQRLQNEAFLTICKFPNFTPVRELLMAFKVPYIYDYLMKLCRQQAEVKITLIETRSGVENRTILTY